MIDRRHVARAFQSDHYRRLGFRSKGIQNHKPPHLIVHQVGSCEAGGLHSPELRQWPARQQELHGGHTEFARHSGPEVAKGLPHAHGERLRGSEAEVEWTNAQREACIRRDLGRLVT